jgi:hypothetical protein
MSTNIFTIESVWMDHSGGTKFYQLFRIRRVRQTTMFSQSKQWLAAVGHYGSMSAVKTRLRRPIEGGQCKVYPGAQHDSVLEEKKRPRNGGRYLPAGGMPIRTLQQDEFAQYLREAFPTAVREEILTMLEMDLSGNGQAIAEPEPAPTTEPETAQQVPDGWGDW